MTKYNYSGYIFVIPKKSQFLYSIQIQDNSNKTFICDLDGIVEYYLNEIVKCLKKVPNYTLTINKKNNLILCLFKGPLSNQELYFIENEQNKYNSQNLCEKEIISYLKKEIEEKEKIIEELKNNLYKNQTFKFDEYS